MKQFYLIAATAAVLALGAASAASAQAPAAAAPTPPGLTANIAGVCVFAQSALFTDSTVGKAMLSRLDQLKSQVQAELAADETAFQTDYTAFQKKAPTLQEQQAAQQQQAFKQRFDDLQQKADLRGRELDATQQRQMARIATAARPLFADVVKQRNCAVVMDGQGILAANPTMDVTQQVIASLNGKMSTIEFDRDHLDAQAAAPAQGAQRR